MQAHKEERSKYKLISKFKKKIKMDERKKNILLQNCNNLDTNQLIDVVKTGHISIDELRNAGLDLGKINQIVNSFINKEQEQRTKEQAQAIADRKNEWLERVIKGKASADEIKANINNRAYTFEDLEEAGINSRTINSLKHYCNQIELRCLKISVNFLLWKKEGQMFIL